MNFIKISLDRCLMLLRHLSISKTSSTKCDIKLEKTSSSRKVNSKIKSEVKQYYREMHILKLDFYSFKNKIISELLIEAGIPKLSDLFGLEKKLCLCRAPIEILKELNFLKNDADVLENLKNQIKDFPYTVEEIVKDLPSIYQLSTIEQNRVAVEIQYLAWKLNTEKKNIIRVLRYYRMRSFFGRSVKSIQKNFELLSQIDNTDTWSLANKILFLNCMPCDQSMVAKFSNLPEIVEWTNLVFTSRKLVHWPHNILKMCVNLLKAHNFTEKQIQEVFVPRTKDAFVLYIKLKIILTNDFIFQYRDHSEFLQLLRLNIKTLVNSKESPSFLLDYLEKSKDLNEKCYSKKEKKKKLLETVLAHLIIKSDFELEKKDFYVLSYHPKWLKHEAVEINETYFNLHQNFSKEEIFDALPIILYKWENVVKALNIIQEKHRDLIKIGFTGDCISSANLFSKKSKSEKKKLSLCLYYMQKEEDFLG